MSKVISKPVCLLAAMALVFSLTAILLTFGASSIASAPDGDMVCQTSLISYNGSGASTTHNFTVPTGAKGGYVIVEFRGDFGGEITDWDEFIDVYIDGDYIGRDYSNRNDCNGNWTSVIWLLSAAQMSGWAADGTISIRVQNSAMVDDSCAYNQHRVTLCYTTAPLTCKQSLISYNGSGANTTHNFSVPMGSKGGYVFVEFRGDFGDWSPSWNWTVDGDEFIEVYIEGDYIGRAHSDNLTDCDGNWTAATWLLGAAQMSGWAADGTISVMVVNSPEVDDFCPSSYGTYNQHQVTLCYTKPEGPPVGGEAYPVSRVSVLAPWIAVGAVVVGAGVLVIRRRKAQS